jgi:hypothetical protein
MIKLKRRVRYEGLNYDVDFHTRKENVIAVYEIKRGLTLIILSSGTTVEVLNDGKEVLDLINPTPSQGSK